MIDSLQNPLQRQVNLAGLWHGQYSLSRAREGTPPAPTFVHGVVARILITRKGVVFQHWLSEHGILVLAEINVGKRWGDHAWIRVSRG